MLSAGYNSAATFGSATALVVGIDTKGKELGVANLGDSGMRQLRFRHASRAGSTVSVVHRTREQQHMFNCPYQLTRLPQAEDFDRLLSEGKTALVQAVQNMRPSHQDQPADADTYGCRLREGDLLILGTDGLFDNIHDDELCQLLSPVVTPLDVGYCLPATDQGATGGPGSSGGGGGGHESQAQQPAAPGRDFTDPGIIASAIAMAAFHRSKDKSARTPFTLHAKEAGLYHVGGKMDDITVVALWVVRSSTTPPAGGDQTDL